MTSLRRSFLSLTVTVFTALILHDGSLAADAPKLDLPVVLGKSVGAITKSSTLEQLQKTYGESAVKIADLPGPEGSTLKGAVLFADSDQEIEIVWDEENPEKEVSMINFTGKGWVLEQTVKVGAKIADVEKANGGPFKISGFDWDYGGYANFEGGKLEFKLSVRFGPTKDTTPEISGEVQVNSTNKKMLAAKPVVETLSMSLE